MADSERDVLAEALLGLRSAIEQYMIVDADLEDYKPDYLTTAEWDARVAQWQKARDALDAALAAQPSAEPGPDRLAEACDEAAYWRRQAIGAELA